MQSIQTARGTLLLPCMTPIIVPIGEVVANNYNPNHVADREMELLLTSMLNNGCCYPVIVIYDDSLQKYVIVDGFHRYTQFKDVLRAKEIPIIVLEHDMTRRMEATVQFNRARGVHSVELMGDLVQALVEQGASDDEIAENLGMEPEEVFRLKQVTGIAALFKNQTYSRAWEMMEVPGDA